MKLTRKQRNLTAEIDDKSRFCCASLRTDTLLNPSPQRSVTRQHQHMNTLIQHHTLPPPQKSVTKPKHLNTPTPPNTSMVVPKCDPICSRISHYSCVVSCITCSRQQLFEIILVQ